MKYLICNFQPFDAKQKIYIMNENTIEDSVLCSMDEINSKIPYYCKINNITDITLLGMTDYTFYLKNKILDYCKTNYDYNELNLNITCGENE